LSSLPHVNDMLVPYMLVAVTYVVPLRVGRSEVGSDTKRVKKADRTMDEFPLADLND
jgi:hypothetical protein